MGRLMSAAVQAGGSGPVARATSVVKMMRTIAKARRGTQRDGRTDPMQLARRSMESMADERRRVDAEVEREISVAVEQAFAEEVADA